MLRPMHVHVFVIAAFIPGSEEHVKQLFGGDVAVELGRIIAVVRRVVSRRCRLGGSGSAFYPSLSSTGGRGGGGGGIAAVFLSPFVGFGPVVVFAPLVGVAENGEGVGDGFEGLGGAVGVVFVRMKTERQFPVGALETRLVGVGGNAQNLVQIGSGTNSSDDGGIDWRARFSPG